MTAFRRIAGFLHFRKKGRRRGLAVGNFGVFPEDQRTSWVYADFDADGQKDIMTSSSSKGEVLFLTGQGSMGFSNPVAYPSLNGITSIQAFDSPKAVGLLVLSPEENLVGLSYFRREKGEAKGNFDFPFIPVKESIGPFSFDLNGDEKDEIILVVEERSFSMQVWQVKDRKSFLCSPR